jgi:DinB superfamily
MERPAPTEYIPYYESYISLVPGKPIVAVLEEQLAEVREWVETVPEERETYRYAPGKWSLREAMGHVVDSERIFAYRACAIARGETQPLPGYEQDDYVAESAADHRRLSDLLEELEWQRRGNVLLFRGLTEAAWRRMGLANNDPVSVRALAYIMAGHVTHHLRVFRERYVVRS